MAVEQWNPGQYARFRDERSRPFYDLAATVQRAPSMRVVDLGCGTGALTAWLHGEIEAAATLGIDSSAAMLAEAAAHATPGDAGGVTFEAGEIRAFAQHQAAQAARAPGSWDLVFSNAALQWVPDHATLLPLLAAMVAPGGQIALQMPANDDHVSHASAHTLAAEEPYASALDGYVRESATEPPEWYAAQLHALGFAEQRVRLEVYLHVLEETRAVVQWVRGTLLTDYEHRLGPELYARFVAEYEARLVAALGEHRPFFYPFKRVLIWGRKPA